MDSSMRKNPPQIQVRMQNEGKLGQNCTWSLAWGMGRKLGWDCTESGMGQGKPHSGSMLEYRRRKNPRGIAYGVQNGEETHGQDHAKSLAQGRKPRQDCAYSPPKRKKPVLDQDWNAG